MKKLLLIVACLFTFNSAFAAVVCSTQTTKSFVSKSEQRGNSKLLFVCSGTSGTVNFTNDQIDFISGKRLYSIRTFPTAAGSVADVATIKLVNSRNWDLLGDVGVDMIDTTVQIETSAYNKKMGGYWFPPFDDENGYSLVISDLAGASSFTVEISVIEEMR